MAAGCKPVCILYRLFMVGAVLSVVALCRPVAGDSVSDTVVRTPGYREKLGYKLAFCQHPMYLIIDLDRGEPTIGERTPPWGAATAADYVQRVKRNLDALASLDKLRLNYQFSGWAMESMAERFPGVVEEMKRMYRKGKLDFIGGTYSQAHLHTLGPESNWRQIEYGKQVFKKLFDKDVKLYARQETGLHRQLPQILRHFGYDFIVMPCFWWVMEISQGPFEITSSEKGTSFLAGDEFVDARSLDGTTIPAYLHTHVMFGSPDWQICKGMFGPPPIWIYFPDLAEAGQKIIDKYGKIFDIVLLEDALRQRYPQAPPRAKVWLHSYWSYSEGVWAEELLRNNKAAEEAAVAAESIYAMARKAGLSPDRGQNFKNIWKTILKYQHHDISWIEVTDARRKAVSDLKKMVAESNAMATSSASRLVDTGKNHLAVFNPLPRARSALVELDGEVIPAGAKLQDFQGRVFGFLELPAGGFESFRISDEPAQPSVRGPLPAAIQTDYYRVEFSGDALIKQIVTSSGEKLLQANDMMGGEIRALIDDTWVSNRNANCRFYQGDVAYIVRRSTELADIALEETYFFYRHKPLVKVELEFDFDGDEVGYFWLDETKINVYYPTGGDEIYNDIPFGYVRAREARPIFATNWLYCGGLAYVNRGTVKHWVKDGVIANVIAWGGNWFNNREHLGWTKRRQYDIRLYGRQKVEYFLIPYGRFNGNRIVKDVEALTWPVFFTRGKGRKSFFNIKDENLAVTAVYEKQGKIRARGYHLPTAEKPQMNFKIFDEEIEKLE